MKILKKQIAGLAGISSRTMRRYPRDFQFIEKHKFNFSGRPSYDAFAVIEEMKSRKFPWDGEK